MDIQFVVFVAFGFANVIVDALVWGMAGYLVFRLLGGTDRRWIVGAVTLAAAFFVWDSILNDILGQYLTMEVRTSSESVTELFAGEIWTFDPAHAAIHTLASTIGFRIGRFLFHRTTDRMVGTPGQNTAVRIDVMPVIGVDQ